MPEPRFLVVRLGSLGDIVHTFPAVAALRESFPNSQIIWLTHPRWKFVVESSSLATEVWPLETRSFSSLREIISRLRKVQWTAAIDYQGLWKSAAIPFLAGVKRRIGFSSESIREFGVPLLYTDRVRTTAVHIADQNGELSLRAGAASAVADFRLHPLQGEEVDLNPQLHGDGISGYIVLSPGGGWRSKCWPAERFGGLCGLIHHSLSLRSVVNYGPGEENLVSELRAASGAADPMPFHGSLSQLMALLRGARCVVGGDTGPLHLAVALGTPTVTLFGPTDPGRNGPYRFDRVARQKDVVLRSPQAVSSYKRRDSFDPSMLELDVATVFDAVRRCIGAAA
jgi:lipopolysaccharide heptosyltransferase I